MKASVAIKTGLDKLNAELKKKHSMKNTKHTYTVLEEILNKLPISWMPVRIAVTQQGDDAVEASVLVNPDDSPAMRASKELLERWLNAGYQALASTASLPNKKSS